MATLKIYEGDYNESEFYSHMGKFFAERKYKKILPYLCNDKNQVWILAFEKRKLIGFTSLIEKKKHIEFLESYIEEQKNDIWKLLNDQRFQYAEKINKTLTDSKENKKPFLVITNEKDMIEFWKNNDFEESRKNGSYVTLIKYNDK